MPVTASDEFWEEARRLGGVVNGAMGEVAKLGVDVIELLAGQEATLPNPQVRAIIKGVEDKNSQYIKSGGKSYR